MRVALAIDDVSESKRVKLLAATAALIAVNALVQWRTHSTAFGTLYLFPILIAGYYLSRWRIVCVALFCALLREAVSPGAWDANAITRLTLVSATYLGAGFFVSELALRFRNEFGRDALIDMVCYRRRGHNEGDDPSMTQPLMYNLIEAKRSVRKLYTEELLRRGVIGPAEAEKKLEEFRATMTRAHEEVKRATTDAQSHPEPVRLLDPEPSFLPSRGTSQCSNRSTIVCFDHFRPKFRSSQSNWSHRRIVSKWKFRIYSDTPSKLFLQLRP